MAADIGARIGLQGEKEFRDSINAINGQLKTFSAQMKAAAEEFEGNAKSEAALTAKNEILKKSIETSGKKLEVLNGQADRQKKKLEELAKELQKASKEYGENSQEAAKAQNAYNRQVVAVNKLETQIATTTAEMSRMKNQLEKGASAVDDLSNEMDEASVTMKKTGDSAADFGDMLMAHLSADVIKEALSMIIDTVKELGQALTEYSQEVENATKKATAYFGETGAEAEKTGKVIRDVYADGIGDSMESVSDAVITVKKNLKDLSDADLTELTKQAMTLDNLYGIDMNETMRGVNSLMTQFGMDAQSAMDYIITGTQNGLDKTNELGDNLAEYAGKFAQAGYSAEEYFQLLENGLEGGAYNLDKVNDAVNEVTTRLADGTIAQSIGGYSKETQQLFEEWKKGGASQKQVIDSIVSDIGNAQNQQEALSLAATAFGTMAEDGNLKFIESLSTVGTSYSDVQGRSQKFYDATTTNQQKMLSAMRQTEEQLAPIGDSITGIMASLTEGFLQLTQDIDLEGFATGMTETFTVVSGILQQVQNGTLSVSDGFSQLLNLGSTTLAQLGRKIAENLPSLIVSGVQIVTALEEGYLDQLPVFIEEGGQLVLEFASSMLENLPQLLEAAGQFIETLITGVREAIPSFVAEAPVIISGIVKSLLDDNNLSQILEAGIRLIGELIAGIIAAIPDIIAAIPQIIIGIVNEFEEYDWLQVGKDILNGIANGIIAAVGEVVTAAKEAAGKVKETFLEYFDIHSPSRVMRDEVGRQITAGIAEGILSDKEYATKSAEEVGSAIVSAAQKELSNYKVYHDLTLAEEAAFWSEMRQKVEEGTQARINADQKYFDARKKLDEKLRSTETDYKNKVSKTYQQLSDNIQAAWKNYHEQVDSLTDSIRSQLNLFEKFEWQTENTTENLLENLSSQVEGMTVWRNSLAKLEKRGLPAGLMEELENMGVSAAGEIKLMSEMTDEELSKYISLWEAKEGLAGEAAREQMQPALAETKKQIQKMREEAKAELQEYQNDFVASMESIGVALVQPLEEIKNALVQNYADTVGTVADTVDKQANEAQNQEKYAQIAENVIEASKGLPEELYNIGSETINGLIQGLNSKESGLYQTITDIARNMINTIQQELDIHSPSRVMKELIGKNMMVGLSDGLMEYKGLALGAAQRISRDISKEFSNDYQIPRSANGTAAAYEKLAAQMGNLKIILNDGTLVGKISPRIDTVLGGYTKIKGRYYT